MSILCLELDLSTDSGPHTVHCKFTWYRSTLKNKTGPTVPVISGHINFDVGPLLSINLCAEFDQCPDEPVPVPSVTLLQDCIIN